MSKTKKRIASLLLCSVIMCGITMTAVCSADSVIYITGSIDERWLYATSDYDAVHQARAMTDGGNVKIGKAAANITARAQVFSDGSLLGISGNAAGRPGTSGTWIIGVKFKNGVRVYP